MTIREFSNNTTQILQPLYDKREAAAIVRIYLQHKLSVQPYELALMGQQPLTNSQATEFSSDSQRLAEGCPVQYVLGTAEFYGRTFHVTPAVLIPRQETEELVSLILSDHKSHIKPSIWDIGTGSGCIAISLSLGLPSAEVYATDISEEALEIAALNNKLLQGNTHFSRHDMCDIENPPFPEQYFDIIVSNPPYIPEQVCKQMHRNVVGYEPAKALFVPDNHPLIFYEAIAEIGLRRLNSGGRIYLETFEDYHQELAELFECKGYKDFKSKEDINGKKRFVTCMR